MIHRETRGEIEQVIDQEMYDVIHNLGLPLVQDGVALNTLPLNDKRVLTP